MLAAPPIPPPKGDWVIGRDSERVRSEERGREREPENLLARGQEPGFHLLLVLGLSTGGALVSIVTGRIEVEDVEELNHAVSPWSLEMRQISAGQLDAKLDFVQVGGILLNRESWSHRILATGATPAGYLTLAGGYCAETAPMWCGQMLIGGTLAYGFDSSETEFVAPDKGDHWVALVPKDLIIDHLGEETAAAVLSDGHHLACEPSLGLQLSSLVDRLVRKLRSQGGHEPDDSVLADVQSQILGTVAEVLLSGDNGVGCSTSSRRYQAMRRAILHAEDIRHAITVPELANAVGVSRRVLELGFREGLGLSPQQFLRWNRLNRMHVELRDASATAASVTTIANRWGFTELGRTAVNYRRLFLESPSETLARDPKAHGITLADALLDSSNTA
jgi:AraC family ethanolamine operon transcriptional activator